MDTVVINNITKKFEHTTAIDDLTLTIPTGQMTGIVGADAAGKTTLLRIIIGLLYADSGTVTTLGYDPDRQKKELIAQTTDTASLGRSVCRYHPLQAYHIPSRKHGTPSGPRFPPET